MSNESPALIITRIKQCAEAKSTELEGCFLKEMSAARLSPDRERLEIITRYAERDFYVRAKALLAVLLASNWRWQPIEERMEAEIESVAALHAGHPLARDIAFCDMALDEWIAHRIRRSGEWHQILRHIHQIRKSNVSGQALLFFVSQWAAEPSSIKHPPSNAPPTSESRPAGPNDLKRKGRPSKYSDAQYEEALQRQAGGETHREIASSVFGIKNPTAKDIRRVSANLSAHRKKIKSKK